MPARFSSAIIAALLIFYAIVALTPFHWQSPVAANRAERQADGTIAFPDPGAFRTDAPPRWLETAAARSHLTVELEVRAFSNFQAGPARIFTNSRDPYSRNLTIAQDGADLAVRVRSPLTDLNGLPEYRLANVFADNTWRHIRVDIVPHRLSVAIDGYPRFAATLPERPLAGWDRSYRAAFGNELTNDRPWTGEIRRASVRTGALDVDYLAANELAAPRLLWVARPPNFVPFRHLEWVDAAVNFLGFIPLGFLLALRARRNGARSAAPIIAFAACVSLGLETLQLFLPDRFCSINDLLLNTAGGAIGLVVLRVSAAQYARSVN